MGRAMIKTDYTHFIPNVDREKVLTFMFELLDTFLRIADVQDCITPEEWRKAKYLIKDLKNVFFSNRKHVKL